MFRKHLIPMLLNNPMSLAQIARATKESASQVANDVQHLLRSLKHTQYHAVVTRARCRGCGFEFGADKINKPSKCPECKSTWIEEPLISIETK